VQDSVVFSLLAGITVLVIACPCALGKKKNNFRVLYAGLRIGHSHCGDGWNQRWSFERLDQKLMNP
jgi:hypothetical protein